VATVAATAATTTRQPINIRPSRRMRGRLAAWFRSYEDIEAPAPVVSSTGVIRRQRAD
jgi:hypothetical protein